MPRLSLNGNWIRRVLRDVMGDEENFEEMWTHERVEALTKDIEDKICYMLMRGEPVRVVDVLLDEYPSFLPRRIMDEP